MRLLKLVSEADIPEDRQHIAKDMYEFSLDKKIIMVE